MCPHVAAPFGGTVPLMPALLTDDQLTAALADLPGWERRGAEIRREVTLADFPTAIAVVGQVAAAADARNHHPDIDVRYDTLVFALSTHSEGGLTQLDVDLATEINRLLARAPAPG